MMATMRSTWARRPSMLAIALFVGVSLLFVASGAAQTLGSASGEISFHRDVLPILRKDCVACHRPGGVGAYQTGLDLTSYAGIMKGSRWGPLVVAGWAFRRSFVAAPAWRTAALAMACAASGAATMSVVCSVGSPAHVLVGHGALMFVAALVGAGLGRRFGQV